MADSETDSFTSSSPTSTISSLSSTMSTEVHTRDDLFYFHSVVFLAETKLFKVPRYGLPGDAAIFDSMFGQATGGAGSSDDNPIRLDADVAAADFRSLLKAAFPPPGTLTAVLTLDEWMGVLTLAKKWKLESMKEKAVSGSDAEIQKKTDVDKILLAKKYTVAKWLKEGYCALASRKDPITPQERKKLGWETCARLLTVREKGREAALLGKSTTAMYNCSGSFACSVNHRPYCAENINGAQNGIRRLCTSCNNTYHIPGCWANDNSANPIASVENMHAKWAEYDFSADVEAEFGASVKT